MRRAAAMATIALAVAAATAPGSDARTGLGTCSAKTVAGARWTVLFTRGLSCGTAYGVVAQLAGRKIPAGRVYAGTYAGMSCSGGPNPGSPPRSIICGTKSKTRWFSSFKSL